MDLQKAYSEMNRLRVFPYFGGASRMADSCEMKGCGTGKKSVLEFIFVDNGGHDTRQYYCSEHGLMEMILDMGYPYGKETPNEERPSEESFELTRKTKEELFELLLRVSKEALDIGKNNKDGDHTASGLAVEHYRKFTKGVL